MYIKGIILDGFKSYGRRTEIRGFDPEFNAITGLNGTGKSNILDSICFVLGITNLGQVRATSLQDLVYKSGQAGIIKATVTLTFDNTNKNQCPFGYEKCSEITVTRQVIVGGKNRYLINGKNVLNKKVQDLFCSVQLNINNPNFLIMQGRITKVLNMKPSEILSMIEEAAGTSMYETKRDSTTKLIEKKDSKLKEMEALLKEEIEPKLEKLRKERKVYNDYQKICNEIEHLTRIHISYKYLQCRDVITNCEKNVKEILNGIEADKNTIISNEKQVADIDELTNKLQEKLDIESGGDLHNLEDQLKKISKEDAASTAERNSAKANIDVENRKLQALKKSIKEDENLLIKKENEMEKVGGMFQSLKDTDEADAKALEIAQTKFEAINIGLSTNEDGEASSLQEQIIVARQQLTEAGTKITQSQMEMKHCQSLLNEKMNESLTSDSAYLKDKKNLENTTNDIKKIQNEMSHINYRDGHLENLIERKNVLTQECRELKRQLDRKQSHRFDFNYQMPEPNFNRTGVKGMVCKLFDVRDKVNCLALEICAGGRLYNVVTDTDVTSKKLLQKGQLQTRTTFIPMNKISGRSIDNSVVQFAQNLVGKENVASAMSLINYNREFDTVMKYCFGQTLICKNLDIAKQVTYHRNIMCRSVTLDGDTMDPDGSLSGGSRPKGGAMLIEIAEIKEMQFEFDTKEKELRKICTEITQIEAIASKFNKLKEQMELRKLELEKLTQSISKTSYQQHKNEIEELKVKVETLKTEIAECKQIQENGKRKIKDIEEKLADSKGHQERELKKAGDEMKRLKKKSEESSKNWKQREQQFKTFELEIVELKKSIETSKEQAECLENEIIKLQEIFADLTNNCEQSSSVVKEMKLKIQQQKDKINSQNKELKQKLNLMDKLVKSSQDLQLNIKKQENDVLKVKADNKDAKSRIIALERKYEWIADDVNSFGVPDTRYDYTKEEPMAAGKRLAILTEEQEIMGRNINQKAMLLLQREEDQYKEVMKHKRIVEDDKKKIQQIILSLDEKKRQAVKKAWHEVDKNFGGIFSSLLPGTNAKLVPPEGFSYHQGLEVKVAFNGLWKESLTELSGGQRSLVALSLILAMLKFKPAPLYILDEVDAALDLSHTQNIGNMLKAHFRNSQFVIVSLKDGMFNNANVLFRTKFTEGMSGITRTENQHNINRH